MISAEIVGFIAFRIANQNVSPGDTAANDPCGGCPSNHYCDSVTCPRIAFCCPDGRNCACPNKNPTPTNNPNNNTTSTGNFDNNTNNSSGSFPNNTGNTSTNNSSNAITTTQITRLPNTGMNGLIDIIYFYKYYNSNMLLHSSDEGEIINAIVKDIYKILNNFTESKIKKVITNKKRKI